MTAAVDGGRKGRGWSRERVLADAGYTSRARTVVAMGFDRAPKSKAGTRPR